MIEEKICLNCKWWRMIMPPDGGWAAYPEGVDLGHCEVPLPPIKSFDTAIHRVSTQMDFWCVLHT